MKQVSTVNTWDGPLRPGGLELTRRAVGYCELKAGDSVVDVGCGTGISVEWMRDELGLAVRGVDISDVLIDEGRQRQHELPIYQASAESLPFDSSNVAAILAECSLSVMQRPRLALAEAFRVLRPGGKLALTDVYAHRPEGALLLRNLFADDLPAVMTREELDDCLHEAGFFVLVWEDHSYVWKEYVARLILANRPLCGCWRDIAGEQPDCQELLAVLKQIRPGYYLLVAEKAERSI